MIFFSKVLRVAFILIPLKTRVKFLFLMRGKKSTLSTYEKLFSFLPSLLVSLHCLSPCPSQCVLLILCKNFKAVKIPSVKNSSSVFLMKRKVVWEDRRFSDGALAEGGNVCSNTVGIQIHFMRKSPVYIVLGKIKCLEVFKFFLQSSTWRYNGMS